MVLSSVRFLAVWLLTFHCVLGQQPSAPTASGGGSTSLVLKLDGPSEVFIDGEKVSSVPSAGIRKFVVSPGEHFLEIKSNGRVWTKKVSVASGTQVAEEVPFAPAEFKGGVTDSGSLSLRRGELPSQDLPLFPSIRSTLMHALPLSSKRNSQRRRANSS